jgi:hypothetical protein
MSELRKHLESGRDAHQTARYPGDLAADAMPARGSWRVIVAQGAVVLSAIAAVVLLAIRVSHVPVEKQTEQQATSPVDEASAVALVFPALAMPEVPEAFASPATQSLSASPPSFPAMSLSVEFSPESKETT